LLSQTIFVSIRFWGPVIVDRSLNTILNLIQMKKVLASIALIIIVSNTLNAQEISTDPANPINEERPALTNNFNWMDRLITVFHPDGGYVDGNDNPIQLGNPYFEREEYQNHFNLFNYDLSLPANEEAEKLYFHPRDGWELLHKHNGFEYDESTVITDPLINRVGPYFMLYNRYTGNLRVLASFDGIGANDKIVTTMKFKNPTNGAPNLAYSGLFNNYGPTSQPMDRKTDVLEIAQASKGAINRGFISSDFQMSYDPCTCDHQSEVVVDFASLNTANMSLEGRLIATSVPLNSSGNSPLLNREDFLTQVYKDGFTVNGGMLTYKNIDALVDKYEKPEMSAFEKAALAAIKGAIKGAASALDKNIINKGAAIVMNDMFSEVPFYKEQKKVGIGLLAAGAKSLTAELFPSHSVPNISFIEGEMVLTGTLEDETPFNNGSINLAVPGSEGSENVQWQYYPTYNKPLGLFTLLETPSLTRYNQENDRSNGITTYHAFFKFQPGLNYAFNPNSEVDVNNTDVFAALELTMTGDEEDVTNASKNLQLMDQKELSNGDHQAIFITPFVSVENLQDVVPKFFYRKDCDRDPDRGDDCSNSQEFKVSIGVKLKLMIEYQFKANDYGKVNRTLQVYTYPVNVSTVNKDEDETIPNYVDLTEIETNWSSTSPIILPQPIQYEKKVWDKIQIQHTVGVVPNIPASQKYIASTIILKPGANIHPGVTLKAGIPLKERSEISAKGESFVTNFCNTNYKGNEYNGTLNRAIFGASNTKIIDGNYMERLTKGITVFPNPNRGNFTIQFEEPATKCRQIKIVSSENLIHFQRTLDTGFNESIDINSSVKPGFYYAKFLFDEGVVTKRIWIQ
jgi:hypothetical protein